MATLYFRNGTAFEEVTILGYDDIYPVGSIYESYDSTSPSSKFGGTWESLVDTFLYGSSDSGTTGGESTHALTSDEMPEFSKEYSLSSSNYITYTKTSFDSSSRIRDTDETYGYLVGPVHEDTNYTKQLRSTTTLGSIIVSFGGGRHTTTCLLIPLVTFGEGQPKVPCHLLERWW